jgi:hypothetical protein
VGALLFLEQEADLYGSLLEIFARTIWSEVVSNGKQAIDDDKLISAARFVLKVLVELGEKLAGADADVLKPAGAVESLIAKLGSAQDTWSNLSAVQSPEAEKILADTAAAKDTIGAFCEDMAKNVDSFSEYLEGLWDDTLDRAAVESDWGFKLFAQGRVV